MGEFERIERFLVPLARHKGGLGLADDCALLPYRDGYELAVTKDAIVENVHFLPDTAPHLIARKMLGVNLSDMAAMGAKPLYYFVAACLPKRLDDNWWQDFTDELNNIQNAYGQLSLMGGDCVTHDGGLIFSLTMMGEVPSGKALRRNQAQVGDGIYVSGTIGDAALGLQCLKNPQYGLAQSEIDYLIQRYNNPNARVALGQKLIGTVKCAIDISDGLLADLKHICDCSAVGGIVDIDHVPLSKAAETAYDNNPDCLQTILTGGDDYELLFTAAPEYQAQLDIIARETNVQITKIGSIIYGNDVTCKDINGNLITFDNLGYQHL